MKTAVVHYWLVNMRGGEKVIEALLEIFPDADIYTHVHDRKAISSLINSRKIYKSFISCLPFAKKLYKLYLPLMPAALKKFNLKKYDLVISSEAGPAKGVICSPQAFHICYCHSPMRYIWDMYHEYYKAADSVTRFFMKVFTPSLRKWDVTSAGLVDRFITNSDNIAKRIRRIYNRESEVVYVPVDIEKFTNNERNPADFYLLFGQITVYKRADIAIEACIKLKRKLVVAGSGMKKSEKIKYEKSGFIRFTGNVSDGEAVSLFSQARALLYPGIEDLGIIPIEAQAAGCPVIAYRGGGALETVKENETGMFFDEQTSDSLIKTMVIFEQNALNFSSRRLFTSHVQQFSKIAFREKILRVIDKKERL
ncbi:MAG: glycosyltransferase [Treponema sp.]|nr:glycosyltransferase [Treponema sp.]